MNELPSTNPPAAQNYIQFNHNFHLLLKTPDLSLSSMHSPLVYNAFSFALFHVFMFSCLLFCSCVIGLISCVFPYYRSICTYSLDPLFLTLGEFQAWDWL